MNQFNTLTTKKKTITITINQIANQEIQVYCNDIKYTSTFQTYSGTEYSIIVQPDMWYEPGELNIPEEGVFIEDTTITVTDGEIQADYKIGFIPDYQPHGYPNYPLFEEKYNIGVNSMIEWDTESGIDDYIGVIDQSFLIIDRFEASNIVTDPEGPKPWYFNRWGWILAFYGSDKPPVEFNKFHASVIDPDGITHQLFIDEGFPIRLISNTGDVEYYPSGVDGTAEEVQSYLTVTPIDLYNLFSKYVGQKFILVMNME